MPASTPYSNGFGGPVAHTRCPHMEKLRKLRDEAKQRGQLSMAIQAEVERGELRWFYVKQVESSDAGESSRMSDGEPSLSGKATTINVDFSSPP